MKREQNVTSVKRFELQGDVVVLYFEKMTSQKEYCVAVDVDSVYQVDYPKGANVKIYDYYQPEYEKSVEYHLPTGKGIFTLE